MGDFGEYISPEKRKTILLQRIARFAEEGYQYELNKKFALSTGDSEAAEEAEVAIQDLKVAISIHEQELRSL